MNATYRVITTRESGSMEVHPESGKALTHKKALALASSFIQAPADTHSLGTVVRTLVVCTTDQGVHPSFHAWTNPTQLNLPPQ